MNTLVDYAKLSTDKVVKGIALSIIKDCPLLEKLPFKDIVGNSLKYNVETVEAGAQFYTVGDTWAESAPNWAQRSTSLCILGGDADVDNFVAQTRSDQMDVKQEVLELKSKAISDRFKKELVMGGTTTVIDANGFKGLLQLIAECESTTTTDLDAVNNSQAIAMHATSATITLAKLDELIDAVLGGPPDFLMTSKRMVRKLTELCRAGGGNLAYTTGKSELGIRLAQYNEIPILVNDFVLDNLPDNALSVCNIAAYNTAATRADTADNTPIFAFQLGKGALCGLQNGNLTVEDIGKLDNKDATRTRIKWYCGLGLFNLKKAAVLTGATDGL